MISRLRFAFLCVCAVAGIGCSGDRGVGPDPYGAPQTEPSRLAKLELVPFTVDLEVGATEQLVVVAHDQYGRTMNYSGQITYRSDNPQVVSVSSAGLVTAMRSGVAVIWAEVSVDGKTISASTTATIPTPATGETVLLIFGAKGFEQRVTHISVGGTVIWHAGPVSWAGTPVHYIWLGDASYNYLETLDVTGGAASFRFTKPGTYNYCAGGCWDPPDFGVIVVS